MSKASDSEIPVAEQKAEERAESTGDGAEATPDAKATSDAPETGEKDGKKSRKMRRRRASRFLDAQGRERPAFLRGFPKDAALAPLVEAFERGDYRSVRRDARRLADETESKQVRAAAEELLERIEPDPLVRYILLGTLALLAFLVIWAYRQ